MLLFKTIPEKIVVIYMTKYSNSEHIKSFNKSKRERPLRRKNEQEQEQTLCKRGYLISI